MKKSLLLASSVLFIASCGGGGGDSNNTTSTVETIKKPTQSGFCAASGSVEINGLSIKISDYDTDKNGCLNGDEIKQATKAEQAKEEARKAARTVSATPVIGDASLYKIKSFNVVGNRDAVDDNGSKKAIINANEIFTINLETANLTAEKTTQDGTKIKSGEVLLFISKKTGSQIVSEGTKGLLSLRIEEKDQRKKILSCQYGDGSSSISANHYKCNGVTKDNTKNITNGTSNLYLVALTYVTKTSSSGKKSIAFTGNHATIKIEISQP